MKLPDEPTRLRIGPAENNQQWVPAESYDALRSLCEQLKEDAERYRWMKDNNGDWWGWVRRKTGGEDMDAAIDAARKE